MKYSETNQPIVCMMTNSTCYKNTSSMGTIKGLLIHSTGANNSNIKRYCQPSDDAKDKAALLKLIGTNTAKNDYNHKYLNKSPHGWIGKLADGSVASVQSLPWEWRCWGCGSGSKGSCNNGYLQIEICEDGLTSKTYFNAVYKEACELFAYLCKKYNLDPKGTVKMGSVTAPVILCHQDAAKLGLASNHADVLHWFPKHGKTMNDFRNDIAALLQGGVTPTPTPTPKPAPKHKQVQSGSKGEDVKTLQTSLNKLGYDCGKADGIFGNNTKKAVVAFQKANKLTADGICGAKTWAAIDAALAKPVPAPTPTPEPTPAPAPARKQVQNGSKGEDVKYLQEKLNSLGYDCGKADGIFGANTKSAVIAFQKDNGLSADGICGPKTWTKLETAKKKDTSFKVKIVNTSTLRVRANGGTNYAQVGTVKKNEVHTIVQTKSGTGSKKGWGKLQSGKGWISLDYCQKV